MAKQKPLRSFENDAIEFDYERVRYRLLQLNPNTMTVSVQACNTKERATLPFAHLPKRLKKRIWPLP